MDRNMVPSLVDELLLSYAAEKSQAYFIEMVVPLLNQPDSKERPSLPKSSWLTKIELYVFKNEREREVRNVGK